MAATKEDVKRWIATGIRNGHKYMLSVCDTFEYSDYPVYCDNEAELEKAKLKYDGVNMQRINETITLNEHWEETMLKDLKSILAAIKAGHIVVGINEKYCFVTDEDGYIWLLKRPDSAVIGEIMEDEEERTQWPENHYDGEVLFKQYCGEQRGVTIAETFLNALDIEYLG